MGLGGLGGGAVAGVVYIINPPAIPFIVFVAIGILVGGFCAKIFNLLFNAAFSAVCFHRKRVRINARLHEKNLSDEHAAQLRLELNRREMDQPASVELLQLLLHKFTRRWIETSLHDLKEDNPPSVSSDEHGRLN